MRRWAAAASCSPDQRYTNLVAVTHTEPLRTPLSLSTSAHTAPSSPLLLLPHTRSSRPRSASASISLPDISSQISKRACPRARPRRLRQQQHRPAPRISRTAAHTASPRGILSSFQLHREPSGSQYTSLTLRLVQSVLATARCTYHTPKRTQARRRTLSPIAFWDLYTTRSPLLPPAAVPIACGDAPLLSPIANFSPEISL